MNAGNQPCALGPSVLLHPHSPRPCPIPSRLPQPRTQLRVRVRGEPPQVELLPAGAEGGAVALQVRGAFVVAGTLRRCKSSAETMLLPARCAAASRALAHAARPPPSPRLLEQSQGARFWVEGGGGGLGLELEVQAAAEG